MVEPTQDGRGPGTGRPRWQKVVGIIGLLVILGLGILVVAGGGDHGPGRHAPGGDGSEAPSVGGHG